MFARRQDCRTWGSCRIVVIDTSSTWRSSSWTSINNIFFFFFFLFCCNFFHLDIEVAWIADSIDGSIGSWCCSDAWRYRCVVRTGESLCCDSCIENETAVSSAFAIGNSNARWTKDQIHVINILYLFLKKIEKQLYYVVHQYCAVKQERLRWCFKCRKRQCIRSIIWKQTVRMNYEWLVMLLVEILQYQWVS